MKILLPVATLTSRPYYFSHKYFKSMFFSKSMFVYNLLHVHELSFYKVAARGRSISTNLFFMPFTIKITEYSPTGILFKRCTHLASDLGLCITLWPILGPIFILKCPIGKRVNFGKTPYSPALFRYVDRSSRIFGHNRSIPVCSFDCYM